MLRNHIKTNFGVNTDKLELIQISLPFFRAHQSGKVRIENADHVKVCSAVIAGVHHDKHLHHIAGGAEVPD